QISPDAMPRNAARVPIDPTEWNRNDGFSPGSPVVTVVPGLDLDRTGAAPETDIGRSLRADAPIVLLDTTSGRRIPYWAELDQSVPDPTARPLIVRPAVDFREGHRILVGLRRLQDAAGTTIEPNDMFRAFRDGTRTDDPTIEARRPHMNDVLKALDQSGVKRNDLYLAWDFTVASERNLSERMLHIRNTAFESLDDKAPQFQVTQVENDVDDRVARRVTGTFTVPNYLTGDGSSGNQFNTGPNGLPLRNGDYTSPFMCIIPRAALKPDGTVARARPAVYGHGLLGSEREVGAGNVRDMANEHNFVFCATKWIGLSEEDIGNAVSVLQDLSRFPTIADRLQQGILDTLFLGRLMIRSDGFVSDPAFQGQGMPVIDTRELFYDGNSEGGIMGGAATAVAQDWTRAVLGVPGMNYSTLLQRSTDWDTYRAVFDPAYPDPTDHALIIGMIQMLWDRGEANGYVQHLTHDPYQNTPNHRVLIHEAFGDHQVANIATEVEARSIGARAHRPALAPGRSPARHQLWGIDDIEGSSFDGSAIVVWDSGTPAPPTGNVAPSDGADPHGSPRSSKEAREQKSDFLKRDGRVVDVCHSRPCTAPPPP
ncbi:MAG TPA: hypothetical protein VKH17_10830, partial [Acidimicrobiia bacterium]|nr:hypothetical protein [Acidimicrobiia bacterium]